MRRVFVCVVVVVLAVLAACQKATPTSTPTPVPPSPTLTAMPTPVLPTATPASLRFTDDLGNEVVLKTCPQRILSIAPSITESLFALGAGEQVVGRDTNSDYPPEAKNIQDVGSFYQSLPLEPMLALEPDLVIAAEIISKDQVAQMQQAGLTVFWVANPTSLEELFDKLLLLGRVTCHEAEAENLVAQLQGRVQAVREAVSSLSEKPMVFYELDATDPANPWTAGPGTFIDTLIREAGGENVAASLDTAWAQVSVEQLLEWNPDIILLGDANYGVTPEQVAERPGWGDLKAVQAGKVYPVDANLFSRPGPRLVDGLETLAVLFHPDIFCAHLPAHPMESAVQAVCP